MERKIKILVPLKPFGPEELSGRKQWKNGNYVVLKTFELFLLSKASECVQQTTILILLWNWARSS